jgi:hypothetical protein
MALPGRSDEHDYRACPDPDCPRFPCRVYREGWQDGYTQGWLEGEAAGYSAGVASAAGGS